MQFIAGSRPIRQRALLGLSLLVGCLFRAPAHAWLMVSGDINIVNSVITPDGPPTTGNYRFFDLLAYGGDSVLIAGGDGMLSTANIRHDLALWYSYPWMDSRVDEGLLTPEDLEGVDLLIQILPDRPYTPGEIRAMNHFFLDGGNVFLMGDNGTQSHRNAHLNQLLEAMGSSMRILDSDIDRGFHVATGDQLATDPPAYYPFFDYVGELSYAAPSEVAAGEGTPLVYASGMQPIIVIVPEPTSLSILGIGGLLVIRRRST